MVLPTIGFAAAFVVTYMVINPVAIEAGIGSAFAAALSPLAAAFVAKELAA